MAPKSLKQFLLFFLPMFLAQFAISQNMAGYSGSSSYQFVNIQANCTTGGVNCWHNTGKNFPKIYTSGFSNRFGSTIGIDSSNHGWTWSGYPSNKWTEQTAWGTVYNVQLAGDGNYYGLIPGTYACTGYYGWAQWSGSAWSGDGAGGNYCFKDFSVAANGTGLVVGIDINGQPWYSLDYGNTFTKTTAYTLISVSAVSANATAGPTWYAVKSDNTIWQVVETSSGETWTQLKNGLATRIAVDNLGNVFVITSGTGNNVYFWNGSNWIFYNGSGMTFLSNSGPSAIWGVSGGTLYHLNTLGLQHTRTYAGIAPCAPNCQVPPGSIHNHHVCAGFGGNNTCTYLYNQSVNARISIHATALYTDPFSCFEDNVDCGPSTDEGTYCTATGLNFDDLAGMLGMPIAEAAVTAGQIVSASVQSNWLGMYNFQLVNACDTTTVGPPDAYIGQNEPTTLYMPAVNSMDAHDQIGNEVIMQDGCMSFSGPSGPWICNKNIPVLTSGAYWTFLDVASSIPVTSSFFQLPWEGCTVYNGPGDLGPDDFPY